MNTLEGFKVLDIGRRELSGFFPNEAEVKAEKEKWLKEGRDCAVISWVETDDFLSDTLKQVIRLLRDDSPNSHLQETSGPPAAMDACLLSFR